MTYQRPRQRKGFILSAVAWNRDGTVRSTTYEPIRRAQREEAPASPGRRRSIIEVETAPDLFAAR